MENDSKPSAIEHKLAEPIEYFSEPIVRVFLLEPRAKHLARFGEPFMPVYSGASGSNYDVVDTDAVNKYVDELLSLDGRKPADGGGRALFAHLSLSDGIAIRDGLLGFFVKAKLSLISKPSTP
jgi:hypothetical protein